MKPLLMGLLVGVVLSAAAGWFLAAEVSLDHQKQAQQGWEPSEVLVAVGDLEAGTTVTRDHLRVSVVPSQFVTDSAVPVQDLAALLNRAVQRPVQKGDLVLWQHFTDTGDLEVLACVEASLPGLRKAVTTATEAELATLAKGLRPYNQEALPEPTLEADGSANVLVALRDLAEGEALSTADLGIDKAPGVLVTRSAIPGGMRDRLQGATLVVPIQKGDLLRWQFLDGRQAQTAPGCNARVTRAAEQITAAAAKEQAARFASQKEVNP